MTGARVQKTQVTAELDADWLSGTVFQVALTPTRMLVKVL